MATSKFLEAADVAAVMSSTPELRSLRASELPDKSRTSSPDNTAQSDILSSDDTGYVLLRPSSMPDDHLAYQDGDAAAEGLLPSRSLSATEPSNTRPRLAADIGSQGRCGSCGDLPKDLPAGYALLAVSDDSSGLPFDDINDLKNLWNGGAHTRFKPCIQIPSDTTSDSERSPSATPDEVKVWTPLNSSPLHDATDWKEQLLEASGSSELSSALASSDNLLPFVASGEASVHKSSGQFAQHADSASYKRLASFPGIPSSSGPGIWDAAAADHEETSMADFLQGVQILNQQLQQQQASQAGMAAARASFLAATSPATASTPTSATATTFGMHPLSYPGSAALGLKPPAPPPPRQIHSMSGALPTATNYTPPQPYPYPRTMDGRMGFNSIRPSPLQPTVSLPITTPEYWQTPQGLEALVASLQTLNMSAPASASCDTPAAAANFDVLNLLAASNGAAGLDAYLTTPAGMDLLRASTAGIDVGVGNGGAFGMMGQSQPGSMDFVAPGFQGLSADDLNALLASGAWDPALLASLDTDALKVSRSFEDLKPRVQEKLFRVCRLRAPYITLEQFDAGVRHWIIQLQELFSEDAAIHALHALENAANLEGVRKMKAFITTRLIDHFEQMVWAQDPQGYSRRKLPVYLLDTVRELVEAGRGLQWSHFDPKVLDTLMEMKDPQQIKQRLLRLCPNDLATVQNKPAYLFTLLSKKGKTARQAAMAKQAAEAGFRYPPSRVQSRTPSNTSSPNTSFPGMVINNNPTSAPYVPSRPSPQDAAAQFQVYYNQGYTMSGPLSADNLTQAYGGGRAVPVGRSVLRGNTQYGVPSGSWHSPNTVGVANYNTPAARVSTGGLMLSSPGKGWQQGNNAAPHQVGQEPSSQNFWHQGSRFQGGHRDGM